MRAFLIDPEQRTITEIDFAGDYKQIQKMIGCRSFTTGSLLYEWDPAFGFDAVYVSDDCLEDRDDPKHWFQIDADRDPPWSYPIAGKGLVIGTDSRGESCDASVSLEELIPRITFTRRKFRGFKTKTGGAVADLVIEAQAPIIEDC